MYPSYDQVQEARRNFGQLSLEHWYHDDLFTWKWWLLLALTVLPYILWWQIANKRRAHELLLFGMLTAVFAIVLDNLGTELMWWGYPDKLVQFAPPLFPADLVLVPVCLMTVYQFFGEDLRRFLIAITIWGALLAYIGEPFFIWLGYYQLITWKLTYSLIFYVVASTLARWIVRATRHVPEAGRDPNHL